jgi:hypothetical protein
MVSNFDTPVQPELDSIIQYSKEYKGIEMVALSIGKSVNPTLVQSFASDPKDEHIYQISDAADLEEIVNAIVKVFCIPSKFTNMLLVWLHGKLDNLFTGYCIHIPVDVVFVVDLSPHTGERSIVKVLDFLKDVHAQLMVSTNDARMSVIVAGEESQFVIPLSDEDVMSKLDGIPVFHGDSDLDMAMSLMMDQYRQEYVYTWSRYLLFHLIFSVVMK